MVSSSSKWRSLISNFFICVSTSKATRLLIFLSSTWARCWGKKTYSYQTSQHVWLLLGCCMFYFLKRNPCPPIRAIRQHPSNRQEKMKMTLVGFWCCHLTHARHVKKKKKKKKGIVSSYLRSKDKETFAKQVTVFLEPSIPKWQRACWWISMIYIKLVWHFKNSAATFTLSCIVWNPQTLQNRPKR